MQTKVLVSFVLLALVVCLPENVAAQIWIDGKRLNYWAFGWYAEREWTNDGVVENLRVGDHEDGSSGTVWNNGSGKILEEGAESGTIKIATVEGSGELINAFAGEIFNVTVKDNGEMYNENNGFSHVETLELLGGYFENKGDGINGNSIDVTNNGVVSHANVHGGTLMSGGGIRNATVNGGTLQNNGDGIIEKTVMNGGVFNNNGRTDELTYNGGIYQQTDSGIAYNHFIVGASERIGTLLNNGAISQATVKDGGAMYNRNNGSSYVGTLDIFGGYFENNGDNIHGNPIDRAINGVVNNANVHGGTLVNGGGIHNTTAVAGKSWTENGQE